jgi:hypothetical protein
MCVIAINKAESGFCTRKQKNQNNFESPDHKDNSSFCMMVRIDCGFSSLYDKQH